MHFARYPRPRRIAVAVALTAAALGVSVVPAAASGSQQVAQVNNIHPVPEAQIPSVGMLIPERLFGDDDFAGHGPDIFASAALRIGVGSPRNLHVFLCLEAEETRKDFTRVNGCEFYLIFQAPAGECVDDVRLAENLPLGTLEELKYRDKNYDLDVFGRQVHDSFVQSWEVLGDTSGSEAGKLTGARIHTHRFFVTTHTSDLCR